jgi:hypothetical protein
MFSPFKLNFWAGSLNRGQGAIPARRALQGAALALLLLVTGCGTKDAAKQELPVVEAAKPKLLEAQIGGIKLTGRQLNGYEFTAEHAMALSGVTRWQDLIVFGAINDEAKGRNYLLKALKVNLEAYKEKKPELEPALQVFNQGILKPGPDKSISYSDPSSSGQILYFGTKRGFASYQKEGVSPVNDAYGFVKLALDPDGQTAYAYSARLYAVGRLENGTLTPARKLTPGGITLGFSAIDALTVGPDHKLYAAGVLPNPKPQAAGVWPQSEHKIGIFTPELKLVDLIGTGEPDVAKARGRVFAGLGVTSKFIFSWKQEDFFTKPAQLCVWDLQGAYQGQVSAEKVLGQGWQPVAVSSWDKDTLLLAAAKLTREEQVKLPEKGNTSTKREWTYRFFLVQLTGEPGGQDAAGRKDVAAANKGASVSGAGSGTQNGNAEDPGEAVSLINRSTRYQLQEGDELDILKTEDRSKPGGPRETWYIVEVKGEKYGHRGLSRLALPESVFKPVS